MKKKGSFKNILIFGHSNIGDVCYDLAVVSPLRKAYPKARISFVTSKKASELGRILSGIDEVVVFDKHGKDKGISGYVRFMKKIRRMKYDLAVILRDMQMHYFLSIPTVLKLKKNDVRNNKSHVARKYLRLLKEVGIRTQMPKFEFQFSDEKIQYVKKLLQEYQVTDDDLKIGIMPLAGWSLKCWPIEHWNALIDNLYKEFKAKIFIFGKTEQIPWEREFKEKISSNAISFIDKLTIGESAALLYHMNLFIGPDTSLLHQASCMGIPTIGLYGATDKDFIYPFFHKQNLINSNAKLKCMPCYPGPHGGSCRVQNQPGPCMQEITPEQVLEKIKLVLNK